MAVKDLFQKNEDQEQRPVNPTTLLGIRTLAVGYLIYCLWKIIKMYIDGGEGAPSIWLLVLGIVVLGGGAVWIAIMTFLSLKQLREEERARLDAEDAAMAEGAGNADLSEEQDEDAVSV